MTPGLNDRIDREVLDAGEPRRREAHVFRRGKEHVLADVRFPVRDGTGEIVAIAGIDVDISAQKRNEAELAELLRSVEMARDAAEEAASAKSRFLANMSHELRTPLNAILGFTRLVSRNADGLPPRQVDNLGKILVSAQHLLSLIDEILDLSRIEAGEVRVEPSEFDLAEVVREVSDTLDPLVNGLRVQLRIDVSSVAAPAFTDRDKVKQILLNLVSNAVKYTDDGTIDVRAETAAGRLRVAVVDTGLGISEQELTQVFDEFHRSGMTIARMRSGTGLGLSISRRLARAMGGDISAASRLGSGSTFTLDLPLRLEAAG